MSGPAPEAKPAAQTSASPDAAKPVDTYWYVDYHQLAGNYTRTPYRMGDDQLVVEHLKIVPDSDGAQILRGGNAASSGQVLLGEAMIPASTGQVSAAIRYAKRSSFKLDVSLQSEAKGKTMTTSAERKQLAAIEAEMRAKLDDMLLTRGDYAAIQAELAAEYADRFPDKQLAVKLLPAGAKGGGTTFTASAGAYDASRATKFLVTIDPGQVQNHETTYSQTSVEDHGHATHDNSSVTSTNDVTTQHTQSTVDSVVSKFEAAYHDNVQETFQEIATRAVDIKDVTESDLTRNVTWKLGLNPKDEKKDDDSKDKSKPGLASRLWGVVKTVGHYAKHALGKVVKLGEAAFDLGGDLLGTITGRGWFSRESSDGSSSKDTHSNTMVNTRSDEAKSLDDIGKEFVHAFDTSHLNDLKNEITAHIQVSSTTGTGNDATDKTTTTKSVSGSTTTHDAGDLQVSVKAKG